MTVIEQERHVERVEQDGPAMKRDVLHRAADLIEEFGWRQGPEGMQNYLRPCAPLCILGAIARAHLDLVGSWNRKPGVYPYLGSASYLGTNDPYEPYDWNDERGRSKAEVVSRLREEAENV